MQVVLSGRTAALLGPLKSLSCPLDHENKYAKTALMVRTQALQLP
jgi:hypothetical protein